MEPLVSVCIPAYNNAGYIKDTVESILQQTYQNIEVIIIPRMIRWRFWKAFPMSG